MEGMRFTEPGGNPMAQGTAKNTENRGDEQRRNGSEKKQKCAQLTMKEAGFVSVVIDNVDALHDQLHDLRAGDDRASPADNGPFPGLRPALDQKFGDDLATAGRQILGEVGDKVEHV